jgi:hypothetical protein
MITFSHQREALGIPVMRRPVALVPSYGRKQRMQKRRRFKQTQPLEARLAAEAERLREQARMLPHGRLRDEVERKVIQFEAAYEVSEVLRAPVSGTGLAGQFRTGIGTE